jgi:hypothetical protein
VAERRNLHRLQLDVQLDDLQSEIEAGARRLEKIHDEAWRVDRLTGAHLHQAGLTGRLRQQITELRESLTQQRALLRQLRGEMQALRAGLKRRPIQ